MRLAEWRIGQGLTQSELAAKLGCDQSFISYIERANDPMIPRREFMLKIYRFTFGAVTPNDFYNLPVLEQLALPMEDQKPAAPSPAPLFDREPAPEMARAA